MPEFFEDVLSKQEQNEEREFNEGEKTSEQREGEQADELVKKQESMRGSLDNFYVEAGISAEIPSRQNLERRVQRMPSEELGFLQEELDAIYEEYKKSGDRSVLNSALRELNQQDFTVEGRENRQKDSDQQELERVRNEVYAELSKEKETEDMNREQGEAISPEEALQQLSAEMDAVESQKLLPIEKAIFIEKLTNLLRNASQTENLKAHKIFREDNHLQKLKISSKYWIRNSFDRDIHEKVISYLGTAGIETTEEERAEIRDFFEKQDTEKREEVLGSYAENGLLTLKSAFERGVLKETSSTPGDTSSARGFEEDELSHERHANIRGYELTSQDVNNDLFYGRNSFFGIVLERGGEAIDRAFQIPKIEVENRLRNSMIFVVGADKVKISRRTENVNKEDIISRDVGPEEIDYLLVDKANLSLAQEAFGDSPIKIIGVDTTEANIVNLSEGPYELPNYKDEINRIAQTEGTIWCHVARLPVDTYPEEHDTRATA